MIKKTLIEMVFSKLRKTVEPERNETVEGIKQKHKETS